MTLPAIFLLLVCGSLSAVQPSQPGPAPIAAKVPAIERFSPTERAQIRAAARAFVVTEKGVYWDHQIEDRQAASVVNAPRLPEAERRALGLATAGNCRDVPLWFAAVKGERASSDAEINAIKIDGPKGCKDTRDRFVCVDVIDDTSSVVERWRDNMDAVNAWNKSASRSAGKRPAPQKLSPTPVVLKGHAFKGVGDAFDNPSVREDDPVKHAGTTYQSLKVCEGEEFRVVVREVSADELAQALIDGKAKLSQWRWTREPYKDAKGQAGYNVVWIVKDVTPTPSSITAP